MFSFESDWSIIDFVVTFTALGREICDWYRYSTITHTRFPKQQQSQVYVSATTQMCICTEYVMRYESEDHMLSL